MKTFEEYVKLLKSYEQITMLYSGGCDSTLLLDRVLSDTDRVVETYTIGSPCIHQLKLEAEQIVRERYIRSLPEEKRSRVWQRRIVVPDNNDYSFNISYHDENAPLQTMYWLTHFLLNFAKNGNGRTALLTGHIRGDFFFDYDNYPKLMSWFRDFGQLLGKDIELLHPLDCYLKSDIVNELRQRKLGNKVWFCESPVEQIKNGKRHIAPCGTCTPCKHNQWLRVRSINTGKPATELDMKKE
jgi:7-cyano-7-deazaguanine synthase in queuosine biosynthesis